MSKKKRQVAVLKVLAAAAWADGHLDNEEINTIKELMIRYGLNPQEISEVTALMDHPVSYSRCEELMRDLVGLLGSDSDRHEVMDQLRELFASDGHVSDEEKEVLDGLEGVLKSMSFADGFMSRVTGVFRRALPGKKKSGPLTEFLKNAVLQRMHDVSDGEWQSSIAAEDLNRYTLFGAVLGKVAAAEDGISPEEIARIRSILKARFDPEPAVLEWIVQSVEEVCHNDMDRQALLSEYNRISEAHQRKNLLDAAFAVAASDGVISQTELEELRLISNFLWLDPRAFNEVRRKWMPSA